MLSKKDSYEWWLKKIAQRQKKSFVAEDYKKMNRRRIGVGSLIMYKYSAKTELDKLKFWDKNPVTIIFSDVGGYFTSLNLHYIPVLMREVVLAKVIMINKMQIKNDKRFKLAWNDLKEFIKRNGLELAIRKYIKGRMSSVEYIKGDDWKYVASLPSEKFVFDGKMSADQLYKMIRSHAKKTRKSKNKRYGR